MSRYDLKGVKCKAMATWIGGGDGIIREDKICSCILKFASFIEHASIPANFALDR